MNSLSHLIPVSRTSGLMQSELNYVKRLRDRYTRASLLLNSAIRYSGLLSRYTNRIENVQRKRFYSYRNAVLAFIDKYPGVYIG